jgi:hypothetical protein
MAEHEGRTPHALAWSGAGIAILALAGLGAYFVVVGLDKANKLAGIIGVFVGLAGLSLSVYGIMRKRDNAGNTSPTVSSQNPQVKTQLNIARMGSTQYAVLEGEINIHDGPAAAAAPDNSQALLGGKDPDPGSVGMS